MRPVDLLIGTFISSRQQLPTNRPAEAVVLFKGLSNYKPITIIWSINKYYYVFFCKDDRIN